MAGNASDFSIASSSPQLRTSADRRLDVLLAAGFALVVLAAYALIFNRETSLSYSIGYNLYGAERVLDGEVPYRDFHTLYPPGTVYLNAAIFGLFGISLYAGLAGVLVFKTLTALGLYLSARAVMPRWWALAAGLFAILWLRPNGPFKAVPMHYGALFLAFAQLVLLRNGRSRSALVLAGILFGVVAIFKHNIGVYGLLGTLAVFLLSRTVDGAGEPRASEVERNDRGLIGMIRPAVPLLAGFISVTLPVIIWLWGRHALKPMVNSLLFGPGEFLISRLASTPAVHVAGLLFTLIGALAVAGHRFRGKRWSMLIWLAALVLEVAVAVIAKESLFDGIVFYAPIIVLGAGLALIFIRRSAVASEKRPLMFILAITGAAFMEVFPRFAREQIIAAMPFIVLLLVYVLYRSRGAIERLSGSRNFVPAMMIAPVLFLVVAARLLSVTYFDSEFRIKSDTELAVERGRGVYFPAAKADEIAAVVGYVERRVPESGYFFAHSYAGSAFLFLADRRNPSGAQFWGGVGVSESERRGTIAALEELPVNLVVTSEKDLAAERYEPMRAYLEQKFEATRRIGEVLILERRGLRDSGEIASPRG